MKIKDISSQEDKLTLIFWMLIWQGIGLVSIPFTLVYPFLGPRTDPMLYFAKYVMRVNPLLVVGLIIISWVYFAKNKYKYSLVAAITTTFWDMLVWMLIARLSLID